MSFKLFILKINCSPYAGPFEFPPPKLGVDQVNPLQVAELVQYSSASY